MIEELTRQLYEAAERVPAHSVRLDAVMRVGRRKRATAVAAWAGGGLVAILVIAVALGLLPGLGRPFDVAPAGSTPITLPQTPGPSILDGVDDVRSMEPSPYPDADTLSLPDRIRLGTPGIPQGDMADSELVELDILAGFRRGEQVHAVSVAAVQAADGTVTGCYQIERLGSICTPGEPPAELFAADRAFDALFVGPPNVIAVRFDLEDGTSIGVIPVNGAGVVDLIDIATVEVPRVMNVTVEYVSGVVADLAPLPSGRSASEQLERAPMIWMNQLGLVQDDLDIWQARLDEACTLGVWNADVALRLAERYIAEDEAVSARPAGLEPPSPEDAANRLWGMAVQACSGVFPEGAIDSGPPFGGWPSSGG